jgi:methylphosphotriester-DNA--protein-cysteine methyltransferase
MSVPPTAGETIALTAAKGALRPCRRCRSVEGFLTGPAGPHWSGVRCAVCDLHLGWLPAPKPEDADDFDLIED